MNLATESDLLESLSDTDLEQIEQRIQQDLSLRIHNFHLRPYDGGLILEGRTKTYYGKQLVQHAVMDATGLPIRANNIFVG